ncbi:hypothetical protein NDU88_007574 [Pleurodeles waltl]|uniref:Uncharacterized protein n=1 Tax=Pleurodeles waltl TaxID=8319 RepID=A0AAV7WI48_PLEWA|nr:hypothetical protein NDU88_007574 [Pleurodeles waltl]
MQPSETPQRRSPPGSHFRVSGGSGSTGREGPSVDQPSEEREASWWDRGRRRAETTAMDLNESEECNMLLEVVDELSRNVGEDVRCCSEQEELVQQQQEERMTHRNITGNGLDPPTACEADTPRDGSTDGEKPTHCTPCSQSLSEKVPLQSAPGFRACLPCPARREACLPCPARREACLPCPARREACLPCPALLAGRRALLALLAGRRALLALLAGRRALLALVAGRRALLALVAGRRALLALVAGRRALLALVAGRRALLALVAGRRALLALVAGRRALLALLAREACSPCPARPGGVLSLPCSPGRCARLALLAREACSPCPARPGGVLALSYRRCACPGHREVCMVCPTSAGVLAPPICPAY